MRTQRIGLRATQQEPPAPGSRIEAIRTPTKSAAAHIRVAGAKTGMPQAPLPLSHRQGGHPTSHAEEVPRAAGNNPVPTAWR